MSENEAIKTARDYFTNPVTGEWSSNPMEEDVIVRALVEALEARIAADPTPEVDQ